MEKFWEQLDSQKKEQVLEQYAVLASGTEEIVPAGELKEKIAKSIVTGEPLKVKLGLDPSAPDVHLGHTVVLNKLKQFQQYGHTIQLIIGDFTGKIGDPTGKSSIRKQLTDDEVKYNAKTYFEQFGKVIDTEAAELHYNSRWLSKLSFEDVIRLAGSMTVARMLERDDFEKRMKAGKPVSLHEFFYPLMQGYDSVVLESDVELGGTDQYFNVLMGRTLQEHYGREKQAAMLMPLLEGLDGVEKMSKSKGNYIGIKDSPADIYGKTMSIPDELMLKYFQLAANISLEELSGIRDGLKKGSLHPRDVKMDLAGRLTAMYHGKSAALQAEADFKAVFQAKGLPDEIPEIVWTGPLRLPLAELLVEIGLMSSKSEARRMIDNGGIRLNGVKAQDAQAEAIVEEGLIIQAGKRKFRKIVLRA